MKSVLIKIDLLVSDLTDTSVVEDILRKYLKRKWPQGYPDLKVMETGFTIDDDSVLNTFTKEPS